MGAEYFNYKRLSAVSKHIDAECLMENPSMKEGTDASRCCHSSKGNSLCHVSEPVVNNNYVLIFFRRCQQWSEDFRGDEIEGAGRGKHLQVCGESYAESCFPGVLYNNRQDKRSRLL